MSAAPELSAVVLCYRAAESVPRVAGELHRTLREAEIAFELVLVAHYDSGDDPTPAIARSFAESHEHVRVLADPKPGHGAMGADLRSGLAAARGDHLVVIDGDSQNPVDDVLRVYRYMKETGVEVAKGRRVRRFDSRYRRAISVIYNALFRIVFRTRGLWDINGKPKALTRAAYERLDLRSDDWFVDAEMVLAARRAGMRVGEVPVVFNQNRERASFVKASAILEFLANMTRARLGRGR